MVISSPTAARSVVSMTCTRFGGQPGGLQAFLDQRGDGAVGADGFRAAAQDGSIAGFEAERRGVGGDVRTSFVNNADDAERDAHLADLDAGRAVLDVAHLADRIGQRGDLFDAFGHVVDAFVGQRQAVQHGGFQAGGTGGGEVFGIGGEQRSLFAANGGGDVAQGGVLLGSRRSGQPARGGPRLAADGLHVFLDVHDVPDAGQRNIIASKFRGNFQNRVNSYPQRQQGFPSRIRWPKN